MLREAMQAAAERIQSAEASQEGAEQAAAAVQAEAAELRKRVARLQGEVSVLSQEQVRSGAPYGVPAGVVQRFGVGLQQSICNQNRTGALPAGVRWGGSPMHSQRQVAAGW